MDGWHVPIIDWYPPASARVCVQYLRVRARALLEYPRLCVLQLCEFEKYALQF